MTVIDEIIDIYGHCQREALVHGERTISYAELKKLVYRMRDCLFTLAVSPGDKVVILLQKSIESIIGMFGVLKCGAAYVPVDYDLPVERIIFIVKNSGAKCIITDAAGFQSMASAGLGDLAFLVTNSELLVSTSRPSLQAAILWEEHLGLPQLGEELPVVLKRDDEQLAYIIYTSGSTGAPKGVMIRQKSLVAFVQHATELIGYDVKTRYLNVNPLYFDGSIADVFCTLYAGGTLVLMGKFILPGELLASIDRYEITDTLLQSSVLRMLTSRFAGLSRFSLKSWRTLWYGGEPCSVAVLRKVKAAAPWLRFIHGYGPTEVTHTSTWCFFDQIPEQIVDYMPIGKPLRTVRAYALNDAGELIRSGEIGELYLGGIQLMLGYCCDEQKTKESLLPDDVCHGELVYRTGDFVRIDDEGNYWFCYRKDDMIKRAGNLVHISEITKILLSHDKIQDAIVLPFKDDLFANKIKAIITPHDASQLSREDVLTYLRRFLPSYMMPDDIVFVTSELIPMKSHGKLDRKALFDIE